MTWDPLRDKEATRRGRALGSDAPLSPLCSPLHGDGLGSRPHPDLGWILPLLLTSSVTLATSPTFPVPRFIFSEFKELIFKEQKWPGPASLPVFVEYRQTALAQGHRPPSLWASGTLAGGCHRVCCFLWG